MRRTRVHVPLDLATGAEIDAPDDTAHHLRAVLRLKDGDAIRVFNGRGGEFDAVLATTGGKGLRIICGRHHAGLGQPPLHITLHQAVATGDRVDQAIQKATELGVAVVQVFHAARSQGRLEGKRLDKKLRHWRRIAVAAAEQSGRCDVPSVHFAADWPAAHRAGATRLLLIPGAETGIGDLQAADAVELAVGPEGGFTDDEVQAARSAGWVGLRCGPRVLRTETAGPAVIAALQAVHGDW